MADGDERLACLTAEVAGEALTGRERRLVVHSRQLARAGETALRARLECVVRQRLAAARTARAGLYAGNPTRTTARPTTEPLLERVEGLTLTIIREGRRRRSHLTPLSRVHQRILALLDFPVDIYTRLCPNSRKPL
jgi:hypothetical protein